MNSITSVLDKIEKFLCVLLLIMMTSLVIIQIVLRTLGLPLSWTEELARYCFVWVIYIGISYAARHGRHLKVDVLSILVKERGTLIFRLVTNISSVIFFLILAYVLSGVLERFMIRPQYSPSLKINMIFTYSAPFVCSILASIRYIIDSLTALQMFRGYRKNKMGKAGLVQ